MTRYRPPTALVRTALLLTALLSGTGPAAAQDKAPADIIERFSGTLRLQGRDIPVRQQTHLIANRDKRSWEAGRAVLLLELRGGSLEVPGQRKAGGYRAGDFWIVQPGTAFSVETGKDSATLSVTTIGTP